MLYPLSYSRERASVSRATDPGGLRDHEVRGLPKSTKWHKFQACEDTLYRSGGSILSVVRRRQW